ncbi:hypothetical protein RSOLAG22IIIB_10271 [Rhizoctonia solani]|uniref:Laminin domain protein n=1 Tax=Rhizoctonia solani TaxID=456999 RepID=A0A0K6G2W2_9AGAM|nr:hypothetical protein RSOLAG22IIIB_10271 [Rhizoctonia solani]
MAVAYHPYGQIYSPPELPPYLKDVNDLKPVVGCPTNQELIAIHTVIRIAQQAINIPGMGGTIILSQLSEHLFNVQMARYRSKYVEMVFPEAMTYTPPALPAHLSVQLEPISSAPSDEEIIKVQDAIRSYQQFANASSIFDPNINMELSQHLFDIQMARYTQRARTIRRTEHTTQPERTCTNNVGTAAGVGIDQPTQQVPDMQARDAIERSNRLAEQANQLTERTNLLIERSNQIAERANQLLERPNEPLQQSNSLAEKFIELFGKLNGHFEHSHRLAELSTKPVEKLEEVLRDISRVLARIQHAIVRNNRNNTTKAADCLTNEKGYTPGGAESHLGTFDLLSIHFAGQATCSLPVMINGTTHNLPLDNNWVGLFLRFYGIGENYFESKTSNTLIDAGNARVVLSRYISSCLG